MTVDFFARHFVDVSGSWETPAEFSIRPEQKIGVLTVGLYESTYIF
jgi:hypothetical protein